MDLGLDLESVTTKQGRSRKPEPAQGFSSFSTRETIHLWNLEKQAKPSRPLIARHLSHALDLEAGLANNSRFIHRTT